MTRELERLLHDSMDAAARAAVDEHRPAPRLVLPAESAGWIRRRPRWHAGLLAAAAVILLAAGTALVANRLDRQGTSPPVMPATSTNPAAPASTDTTPSSTAPQSTTVPRRTTVPPFSFGYQPLWPFAGRAEAAAWEAQFAGHGSQPWHQDAGQTALLFTRNYLGFTDIDRVVSSVIDGATARVGVGYLDPNGQPHTAAVLNVVRLGPSGRAPWEVVGSYDTTFTVDTPAYGSIVTSPVSVRGLITGVDESITVSVRQLSTAAPLGRSCCHPAGGQAQRWAYDVAFTGAVDGVATLVASTGGHLQRIECFAIQGVRTR